MNFSDFAERYLIPPDKRGDRLTRVFVYLCSAVTVAAFVGGTMQWMYGYRELAFQIYVSAFTFPIAFILIRKSKRAEIAGHYVAANVFLQTILFAADQAVGVITLIGIAAGAPLLGKTAGKVWLGIILARALYVAALSPTELASATAAVTALVSVAVFVVVSTTERSREIAALRARASQRTSKNQLRVIQQLVEEYFDALLLLEGEQIRHATPGLAKLLGYGQHEITARPLTDFLHPDERDGETVIGHGMSAQRLELRMRHADGRWVWVEAYVAPDLIKQAPRARYLVLRSFEQEKKVSDQLVQAQRLESMGTMAAAVAHDFNNMLTVILGQADELPDGPIKQEITRIANRAAGLTGKLLTFGHGDQTPQEIIDLSYLMREQSTLLQHALDSRYILIEAYQEEPALVRIAESQFEQVLINLVNNARESMPEGGELEVSLQNIELDESHPRETGHFALLEVRDTGQGMDTETKARVFDPFFSTKERTHSSGLGLSSCYGIAHQHGGFIEVDSEIGTGTSFKVYFPIAETLDHEPVLELIDSNASVLVVDDDPGVLGVVRNALIKAGHNVRSFSDPIAALEYFNRGNTSVLVTDVMMPGTSGASLATKLRTQAPGLPILFISGFTNAEIDDWHSDERTLYLAKPFRGHEVVSRVETLLKYDNSTPLKVATKN